MWAFSLEAPTVASSEQLLDLVVAEECSISDDDRILVSHRTCFSLTSCLRQNDNVRPEHGVNVAERYPKGDLYARAYMILNHARIYHATRV